MDKKALADITVFNKYAKFVSELGRRENYAEIVDRNKEMHQVKYPKLKQQIEQIYQAFVHTKRVLPSMRSMQFGGKPILMSENRIFNCAYAPLELTKFYSELMFLLLGGTGMGYSVQRRHVDQLPKVKAPESDQEYKFQVQDSIIGWADAIKVVAKAFFNAGTLPVFDYRDIRDKGTALITSGGKAPGPEPLKACIENIIPVFRNAIGRRLRPIEAHDISCMIADAVLAGGIRRAAMICLFDRDDMEMLEAKKDVAVTDVEVFEKCTNTNDDVLVTWTSPYGVECQEFLSADAAFIAQNTGRLPWYIAAPWRARANNSAVLPRGKVQFDEFAALMQKVEASGCGEPGIYWTNNEDWGTNPCAEIALRPYQMCNLTEINAGAIHTQEEFNSSAGAAAFLGTLQAGYTDFHYLNPRWKRACEKEALLGVSMTGIASGTVTKLNMEEAAQYALDINEMVATQIGIRPAARVTTVKPAGTTSLVLGTSSGIHAWHAPYYIRRMRAGKNEALAQYMASVVPELVEQDVTNPNQVVLSFPQQAPEGANLRSEDMFSLLHRVREVSERWVKAGHRSGDNRHNVSCTISVEDGDWDALTDWMWAHRDTYNGISVLPHFGSIAYPQMPFEDTTKEVFREMLPLLAKININHVREENGDAVDLASELACSGGACEVI